jgi:hypothetical protein
LESDRSSLTGVGLILREGFVLLRVATGGSQISIFKHHSLHHYHHHHHHHSWAPLQKQNKTKQNKNKTKNQKTLALTVTSPDPNLLSIPALCCGAQP